MNTTKMSLSAVKNKLTREEMKNVLAGDLGGGFTCEWTNVSGNVTAGPCDGPTAQVCETDAKPICAADVNCLSVCCY